MNLSLTTQAKRYVRHHIGALPRGTMLLVNTGEDLDHIEEYRPTPECDCLELVVERPDDTFERFDIPLVNGRIPEELIPKPARKLGRSSEYRNRLSKLMGRGFIRHVDSTVRNYAQACLDEFQRRTPGDWSWKTNAQEMGRPRISWDPSRCASYGSRKDISIAINGVLNLESPYNLFSPILFDEYDHIRKDPEIGRLYSMDWHPRMAALVAHEVAHYIDLNGRFENTPDQTAHGESWQRIYRQLRTTLVREVQRQYAKPLDPLYNR